MLIDAGCELRGLRRRRDAHLSRRRALHGRRRARSTRWCSRRSSRRSPRCARAPRSTQIHDAAAAQRSCEGMVALGLLAGTRDELIASEAYQPYYMHRTSHWLGLDVHDVGAYTQRRRAAAARARHGASPSSPASTCAPTTRARRPALRGIGVRIEDDVLVTDDRRRGADRRHPEGPGRGRGLGAPRLAASPAAADPRSARPMADIESLLKEKRVFEPDAGVREAGELEPAQAAASTAASAARSPERFWARMAKEHVSWFAPWKKVLDWKPPFAKWFVGGKTQRLLQLPRPAPRRRARLAPQQGRDPDLGGRARRLARPHLRRAPPRGLPLRQRAEGARREEGRPRRPLHADDPRAPDRDAGLHAHRRHPQRRVRRLLGRVAARPHRRRRSEGGGHGRRRLSPRHAVGR